MHCTERQAAATNRRALPGSRLALAAPATGCRWQAPVEARAHVDLGMRLVSPTVEVFLFNEERCFKPRSLD